ncbi:hypothetical protein DFH28DRAFT_1134022 [Melampsora americana]|nr:hypothetical protein DFH28DRAFT_1134022 [Melampsora americana]
MSSTIPTSSNSHSPQPPPHDLITPNFEETVSVCYKCHQLGKKPSVTSQSRKTDCPFAFIHNLSLPPVGSWVIHIKNPNHNHESIGSEPTQAQELSTKTSTLIKQRFALLCNKISQLQVHHCGKALAEIEEILKKYWTPMPPNTISDTKITEFPSHQELNTITMGCSIPSSWVPSLIDKLPLHKKKKQRKNTIDEQPVLMAPPLDLELSIANTAKLCTHPVQSPPPDIHRTSLTPPPSLLQIVTSALNTKSIEPHSKILLPQDPPNAISL